MLLYIFEQKMEILIAFEYSELNTNVCSQLQDFDNKVDAATAVFKSFETTYKELKQLPENKDDENLTIKARTALVELKSVKNSKFKSAINEASKIIDNLKSNYSSMSNHVVNYWIENES